MRHVIHSNLLDKRVRVHLIGCGGNGSQVLSGLARLHLSMLSLGHPGGLEVTVFDFDTVSESNVGRQLFSYADVGLNKATVLVHRLNSYYGLDWTAKPERYSQQSIYGQYDGSMPDIVITCVDSAAARREIHGFLDGLTYHPIYWMDLGNEASTGQVVIGEPRTNGTSRKRRKGDTRLPVVTELYPELLDENRRESDTPTCSLAEALERQELFVCQSVATFALQMLWTLFRYGGLDFSAQFINLTNGMVTPLIVDPEAWARFFPHKKASKAKKSAAKAIQKAA